MRTISLEHFNSETILKDGVKGIEYRPLNILLLVMRTPTSPAGITWGAMASAVNVINILTDAKNKKLTSVSFEEAEFKTLCDTLKSHSWPSIDPVVYNWIESVLTSPMVDLSIVTNIKTKTNKRK
jgi:hypothetical protein